MKSTSPSTFVSALAVFGLAVAPAVAHAQACCTNTSVLFPVRVQRGDTAVLGLSVNGRGETGGYDTKGSWAGAPNGTRDVSFEQRILAAVRPWRDLQFSLGLPFVESYRASPGISEGGGGIGDLMAGARYDFIDVQNANGLPGLAVLAGITAPTGTAVDQAHHLLATDATGQGAWQGSMGVASDYIIGERIVLELTGAVTGRLARKVGDVQEQLAPLFTAAFAAAYVFEELQVVALTLAYSAEPDATIDGHSIQGSARRTTTFGVFAAVPLPERFRLQATLGADVPVVGLGQGQTTGVSLTVMALKLW